MPGPTFTPVERRTVAEAVRIRLLASITSGELQPGDAIPSERALCDQFGVARTSLREAIHGLTSLGILERRRNRTHVAEALPGVRIDVDDREERVRQLFETRRVIEVPIAELAAARASDEQRVELRHLAASFTDGLSVLEFRPFDHAFHTAIASACGNPLLAELHGKVLAALFESATVDSLLRELDDRRTQRIIAASSRAHAEIAHAIAAGDVVRAGSALRNHLDAVESSVVASLR